MRIGKADFNPSLIPTLAAIAMIALTLSLGNWQLHRAQYKRDLQARFDRVGSEPAIHLPGSKVNGEDLQFRRVELQGRFDPNHEIYLDNRVHDGVPGYHILEPMQIGGSGMYVLVNRGWIAAGPNRADLPVVKTPEGTVGVEGIAMIPTKRYLELSSDTVQGKLWENLNMEKYAGTVPYSLQPIMILQLNDTGDGLIRKWDRPDTGINMHLGYAFQWFALAVAILVTYIVVNTKWINGNDA
jgi:surfeit locus 1 family protein